VGRASQDFGKLASLDAKKISNQIKEDSQSLSDKSLDNENFEVILNKKPVKASNVEPWPPIPEPYRAYDSQKPLKAIDS
jgi:hypothetical protein